jgi:hypothetical protein
VFDKRLDYEWHAIELSHAQIVFFFRDIIGSGKTVEQHTIAATHQLFHLITGELITGHAKVDSSLFGTGASLALLICEFTVSFTPITLDILCSVILMSKIFTPAINELLTGFLIR